MAASFPLAISACVPNVGALYDLLKWAEKHDPDLVVYIRSTLLLDETLVGLPIEELDLDPPTYAALKREEPTMTIGSLIARTESQVLDIRGIAGKRLDEIKAKLKPLGLGFKTGRGIAPM